MGPKTGGPVSVRKLHCTHVKFHLTLRNRVGPMMMNDSAPTQETRKLVKTYKNVLLLKRTVVLEVCGKTYSKKNTKRWCSLEKRPKT